MTENLRLWLGPHPLPGAIAVEGDAGHYSIRLSSDFLKGTQLGPALDQLLLRLRQAGAQSTCLVLRSLDGGHLISDPGHSTDAPRLLMGPLLDVLRGEASWSKARIVTEIDVGVASTPEEFAALLGLRERAKLFAIDVVRAREAAFLAARETSFVPLTATSHAEADIIEPGRAGRSDGAVWIPENVDVMAHAIEDIIVGTLRLASAISGPARDWLLLLRESELEILFSYLPTWVSSGVLQFHPGDPRGLRGRLLSLRLGDLASTRRLIKLDLLAIAVVEWALEHCVAEAGHWDADGAASVFQSFPLVRRYAAYVTTADPRFQDLLSPWTDLDDMIASVSAANVTQIAVQVAAIEAEVRRIRSLTVEDSLIELVATATGGDEVKARALARRYGADGHGVATLEEIGGDLHLTRERVRQILLRSGAVSSSVPRLCPQLQDALTLLELELPCSAERLGSIFKQAGLSLLPGWSGAALSALAGFFGQKADLADVDGLVIWANKVGEYRATLTAARRASDFFDAASVADVSGRLSAGMTVDAITVRHTLELTTEVHWITGDHFWMDHPEGRNRLVNTCLRMITVISPQTVGNLHEGVNRHFAGRAASGGKLATLRPPSLGVLGAFLDSHPAFTLLDEGWVRAVSPLSLEDLGPEKLVMVGVLLSSPNHVMHRNAFMSACVALGMNAASLTFFTTYSELLQRFGHNVWGLRGASVSAEAVLRVQDQARVDREATDSRHTEGVTPSGRPWTARVITPTFRFSGVLSTDWSGGLLKDRVVRAVDMSDGADAGQLRFTDPFNYGYTRLLGKHRPPVGGVMRVVVDPVEDYALVEFGGGELLEEPFDW